jgi:hypothetical protein
MEEVENRVLKNKIHYYASLPAKEYLPLSQAAGCRAHELLLQHKLPDEQLFTYVAARKSEVAHWITSGFDITCYDEEAQRNWNKLQLRPPN